MTVDLQLIIVCLILTPFFSFSQITTLFLQSVHNVYMFLISCTMSMNKNIYTLPFMQLFSQQFIDTKGNNELTK